MRTWDYDLEFLLLVFCQFNNFIPNNWMRDKTVEDNLKIANQKKYNCDLKISNELKQLQPGLTLEQISW